MESVMLRRHLGGGGGAVRWQDGSLDLKEETSPAWGWEEVGGERRLRLEILALNSDRRGTGSPGRSRKSRYFRAANWTRAVLAKVSRRKNWKGRWV